MQNAELEVGLQVVVFDSWEGAEEIRIIGLIGPMGQMGISIFA